MRNVFLLPFLILICTFSMAQKYVAGYYYTYDEQRIEGFIHHMYGASIGSRPDNIIRFKKSLKSKKEKLTTKEIKSFIVGTDSFTILKNFQLNAWARYDEDFAKVVKTGKINLYVHYTSAGSGANRANGDNSVKSYLLEKDGILVLMVKPVFERNFNNLFGDYKELTERIKSKELTYKDLEQIIDKYNNWHKDKS